MSVDASLSDYGPRLVRAFDAIPVVPATRATVRADLLRGHRARTTRRVRRLTAQASVVAMVGSAVVVIAPSRTQAPAAARPVALVAYHGSQPDGFTADKGPAQQPAQVSSGRIQWGTGSMSLVAVLLAPGSMPLGSRTQPASIDGQHGWLLQPSPAGYPTGAVRRVIVSSDGGAVILVEAADGLHWTDAELANFAAGLHITVADTLSGGSSAQSPPLSVSPASTG